MKWQSIASAPQDGTPFIATLVVHNIHGQKWRETHIIWVDDESGQIPGECDQGWALSDYGLWMPIPEVPDDSF